MSIGKCYFLFLILSAKSTTTNNFLKRIKNHKRNISIYKHNKRTHTYKVLSYIQAYYCTF